MNGNSGWDKEKTATVKRGRASDSSGDEWNTPKRDRRQSIQQSNQQNQDNRLNVSDIINEANLVLYDDNLNASIGDNSKDQELR